MSPLRRDLYLTNEATGWLLTSARMCGHEPKFREGGDDWKAAVADGLFLPLALVQDDSMVVRVVTGAALTQQEESEWVSRLTWRLAVPDGRLVLAAGTEYLEGDVLEGDYALEVEVPPGVYRVDVYGYLHGVNGTGALEKAGVDREGLRAFWSATRSGELPPVWLQRLMRETPEAERRYYEEQERIDTARKQSWRFWEEDRMRPVLEEPRMVDFLVHLTPLDGALEMPSLDEYGWFFHGQTRKPELCPRGVRAEPQPGRAPVEPASIPTLQRQVDVGAHVKAHELTPIDGGEVRLPLRELALAHWVAFLCRGTVLPQLRVELQGRRFTADWPAPYCGIQVTETDTGLTIDFDAAYESMNLRRLHRIAPLLEALPDGAVLSLDTVGVGDVDEGAPGLEGLHRYRGEVRGGVWHISESFPRVSAATLHDALVLAREVDAVGPITLRSPDELERVRGKLREYQPGFQDDGSEFEGLSLRCADVYRALDYGSFVMRERFPGVWAYWDIYW